MKTILIMISLILTIACSQNVVKNKRTTVSTKDKNQSQSGVKQQSIDKTTTKQQSKDDNIANYVLENLEDGLSLTDIEKLKSLSQSSSLNNISVDIDIDKLFSTIQQAIPVSIKNMLNEMVSDAMLVNLVKLTINNVDKDGSGDISYDEFINNSFSRKGQVAKAEVHQAMFDFANNNCEIKNSTLNVETLKCMFNKVISSTDIMQTILSKIKTICEKDCSFEKFFDSSKSTCTNTVNGVVKDCSKDGVDGIGTNGGKGGKGGKAGTSD